MSFHDLIPWYQTNLRALSFRQTSDPYNIWISEIMLQQTQVKSMLPYYDTFLKRYPTVLDLAQASLEDVLNVVSGMGYYRRFKLMHQASKVIVSDYNGQFPNTYDDVRSLPGIGMYTAGAIMSIAYKKPYSALDGNVMRVLSRLYEISDDIRLNKTQKKLNQINQSIIESYKPDLYTHAMMELGATVCRPLNPLCDTCPLQDICQSYSNQSQHQYPYKSKLSSKKEYQFYTLMMIYKDQIAIKKETSPLYEGMYLFPQFDVESMSALESTHLYKYQYRVKHIFKPLKHVFTHQVWHMTPIIVEVLEKPDDTYTWININQIVLYPMPTSHLKVYKLLK